jgi:hypothetical protein
MESFRGKLVRNGQVLVDGIQGRLDIETGLGGAQHWSGFFSVPGGQSVEIQEPFELVLDDGRSNKIRVERVNTTGQGTTASFGRA